MGAMKKFIEGVVLRVFPNDVRRQNELWEKIVDGRLSLKELQTNGSQVINGVKVDAIDIAKKYCL
jgi:hypothetical protein